jgi:hypothetical protein
MRNDYDAAVNREDRMNNQIAGIVRHILTSVGGALVAAGYLTSDEWTAVAGALAVLIGVAWSIITKRLANAAGVGSERNAPPPT